VAPCLRRASPSAGGLHVGVLRVIQPSPIVPGPRRRGPACSGHRHRCRGPREVRVSAGSYGAGSGPPSAGRPAPGGPTDAPAPPDGGASAPVTAPPAVRGDLARSRPTPVLGRCPGPAWGHRCHPASDRRGMGISGGRAGGVQPPPGWPVRRRRPVYRTRHRCPGDGPQYTSWLFGHRLDADRNAGPPALSWPTPYSSGSRAGTTPAAGTHPSATCPPSSPNDFTPTPPRRHDHPNEPVRESVLRSGVSRIRRNHTGKKRARRDSNPQPTG
jgi:hypothetical protein